MKGFSKWIGVIIVLCCGLGLSFPAQADMTPNYVVLKGGIYSPQGNDLQGFDTGFNGEIAFGRYLNKNWAIEGGTGYFETSAGNLMYGSSSSAQRSVDLKVVPLTMALKGIIPVDKFEFYGIGGIGAYLLDTDINEPVNYYYPLHVSDQHSDSLFGGFLGLGAIYNVTPRVFVGLEGKYLWTTKSGFYDEDINLDGIQATLNIGFRF